MRTTCGQLRTGFFGSVRVHMGQIRGESMAKENLTERIGFRLRGEEFKQVVRLAAGKDVSPDDWCREVVREKLATVQAQASRSPVSSTAPVPADWAGNPSQQGPLITGAELVIFRESVRLRWLLQEFLNCCARETLTSETARHLVQEANRADGPVDDLAKKLLVNYGILKSKPTN
jgi:hypothetical protein